MKIHNILFYFQVNVVFKIEPLYVKKYFTESSGQNADQEREKPEKTRATTGRNEE